MKTEPEFRLKQHKYTADEFTSLRELLHNANVESYVYMDLVDGDIKKAVGDEYATKAKAAVEGFKKIMAGADYMDFTSCWEVFNWLAPHMQPQSAHHSRALKVSRNPAALRSGLSKIADTTRFAG